MRQENGFGPYAAQIQLIWEHPLFCESLAAIGRLEQNRIFCGHGANHLFDVARIAYIENLETGMGIAKHLIYAAALLHDIGRHLQYTDGIPHHEASAQIGAQILPECGFSDKDTAQILAAIRLHRSAETGRSDGLAGLLYRADKRSRCCFSCPAEPKCSWAKSKKNKIITV